MWRSQYFTFDEGTTPLGMRLMRSGQKIANETGGVSSFSFVSADEVQRAEYLKHEYFDGDEAIAVTSFRI
ncbi:MAG: hypothetical protein ACLUD0_20350 [Eubacterium ramulus]